MYSNKKKIKGFDFNYPIYFTLEAGLFSIFSLALQAHGNITNPIILIKYIPYPGQLA